MSDQEGLKQLQDAVKTLPPQAVKDLLSIEVCGSCVLRLFGLYEHIVLYPSLPTRAVSVMLRGVNGSDVESDPCGEHEGFVDKLSSHELEPKLQVCKICFGLLDFVYRDEKRLLVKKDSASDFAKAIGETIKQEYSQIDGFSLEVSVPPIILENEQAVWSYLMEKHGSVLSVDGRPVSSCLSTKDALKLSIVDPLEKFLGVKSISSSFRIRLTYSIIEVSATKPVVDEGCKKRKIGDNHNSLPISGSEASASESHADNDGKHHNVMNLVSKESGDKRFQDLQRQLDKIILPCCFTVLFSTTPIYLGGRYLKYSRNVSQSRWIIDDERMGEASVEEIIGGNILPLFKGDNYKFHAAGREDIDVRMLGTGRPFLVEIQNARLIPSEELINEIQTKINSMESKYVKIKNLKVLGNKGWDLMREGEAEKQKQYAALVWISRPLDDHDLQTISELKDLKIVQKTPVRVLHRRSPLEREKVVHWMKVERITGSSQHFLLHLCTQAGTYIKEFVHGDLGRTHPSIGSILGCRTEILQLDVTDVKMDCF